MSVYAATRRRCSSAWAAAIRMWWIAPIAAVALLLSRGLSQAMTIEQCVPVNGVTGWLGIHVAILRVSPSCAAGELAVGASPGQLTQVAVAIAVPLVLINLLAVIAVLGGVRLVLAALQAVGRILRTIFRLPQPLAPQLPAPAALPREARERPRWAWPAVALPARRGPPMVAVA